MKIAWDPMMNTTGKAENLSKIASSRQRLQEVSQEFESLFLHHLLQEMRSTVNESDLLGNRQAEKLFQSMFDEELSQEMSKASGLGLSRMLYEQMVQYVDDKDDGEE